MSERVLAVIVSYNPEIEALKNSLEAVQAQSCDLLVVDNASRNLADIRDLVYTLENTSLLSVARNTGLGAAHNRGIEYAEKHGYTHVLILDQDSVPLSGMLDNLKAALAIKTDGSPTSAVGATYLNADNGSESFFIKFGRLKFERRYCGARDEHGCIEADFLISSGSLISLSVIQQIGLMDEALFIDHVDTEWFLRAKSKGFKAWGVCDAVMQHGLGETTHQLRLGGRQRNVPQHKPFRYYYIFRNSILLYKRSYASGLWKWNDVQRLAMIALMFGVFRAPRWHNFSMMLRGVWHGLRGVTGPLDVN